MSFEVSTQIYCCIYGSIRIGANLVAILVDDGRNFRFGVAYFSFGFTGRRYSLSRTNFIFATIHRIIYIIIYRISDNTMRAGGLLAIGTGNRLAGAALSNGAVRRARSRS